MNALATGVFVERVRIDCGGQRLTTNFGQPIADNQNSFTHFDHERIPERIVPDAAALIRAMASTATGTVPPTRRACDRWLEYVSRDHSGGAK